MYMGSEEITICGGNEGVKIDRIGNERIRGIAKVGEISKKVQESSLTLYGHTCIEKRRVLCVQRVMVMEVSWKRRR